MQDGKEKEWRGMERKIGTRDREENIRDGRKEKE